MQAALPDPLDHDQFTQCLADYQAALSTGLEPAEDLASSLPAEWSGRLARAQSCLRLLNQDRQRHQGAVVAVPATAELQHRLGRFQILRELGSGAHGVVYQARDPLLRRDVALKVPRLDVLFSPERRQRFLHEARAAAGLSHPNLLAVYEAGEEAGLCYIASAYCPGPTLLTWLRMQPTLPPPRSAAALVAALAEAVQHAHDHGVLHRDLKPANVLLHVPEGETPSSASGIGVPMICDFGLAKLLESGEDSTRSGAIVGTPSYMAPEQAGAVRGHVQAQADIYALGAILYELLTSRPPFQGTSVSETLYLIRHQDPVGPRRLQPGVPRDLEAVCLRCLEKEPAARYATARELADDLRRFLAGEATRARPVGPAGWLLRWVRRRPRAAALTLGAVLLIVAAPSTLLWYSLRLDEARRIGSTQEFFSLLNQVRQRQADPAPGWTWENLDDLRRAARLPAAAQHGPELRTSAAAALSTFDLRRARTVAEGFRAYASAYTPDGRLLALGEWASNEARICRVLLIDPDTGATVRCLTFPASEAWEKEIHRPDGCRHLTISPNGRWLVVWARSNLLHRWDLTTSHTEAVSWNIKDPLPLEKNLLRLQFHPDSQSLYTMTSRWLERWSFADGPLVQPTSWEAVASLPATREALAAAAGRDGRVYAIGGVINSSTTCLDTVYAYTPGTNSWIPAANMPANRRYSAAATGPDGRIYVLGGTNPFSYFSTVYAFTASTNSWEQVANMPAARACLAAVAGSDGRIYALGGLDSTNASTDTVYAYTPGTNSWEQVASLPIPLSSLAGAAGPDGRIYAIGGVVSHKKYTDTVFAYTPGTNSWEQVASLPEARYSLATATGPDSRIYAIGGLDSSIRRTDTVYAYSPRDNTWEQVARLPDARCSFAAVAGPDGRIYTLGGNVLAPGSGNASVALSFATRAPSIAIGQLVASRRSGLDNADGKQASRPPSPGDRFQGLVLRNHGKTLACTDEDALCYLDPFTLQLQGPAPGRDFGGLASVGPGEESLVVLRRYERFVVDPRGRLLYSLSVPPGLDRESSGFDADVLSPDQQLLASPSGLQHHVKIWDLTNGAMVGDVPFEGGTGKIAFHPGSRQFSLCAEGRTEVYELRRNDVNRSSALSPNALVGTSIREQGLACVFEEASQDGTAQLVIHTRTTDYLNHDRHHTQSARRHRAYDYVALDGNGRRVVWTTPTPPTLPDAARLLCWDLRTNACTLNDTSSISALCLAPDSRLWATGAYNVRVWELPEWREAGCYTSEHLVQRAGHTFGPLAVGREHVLAGRNDGELFLLNPRAEAQASWPLFDTTITSVALSADEQLAACGSRGGAVRVLRLPGGEEVFHLPRAHTDAVEAIAYSANGILATGGRDRYVRLWKPDGTPWLVLRLNSPICALAFDPTGCELVVAGAREHAVRHWRLDLLAERWRELGIEAELPHAAGNIKSQESQITSSGAR